MTSFTYLAVDSTGKKRKGNIEAASEEAAKGMLKSQGMTPIDVSIPTGLNKEISLDIGGKVKPRDLAVFCKSFQSILHAGVTIIQALEMLETQTTNKKLNKTLAEVRILVEKGDTLSEAMSGFGDIFPPILINMVEAGEASGNLEISLTRMAEHFDKDTKIKSMVKQAMIYPVVLLIVIICVVAIMLIKIVPMFQETFDQAGAELPGITLAVVAMSDFLVEKWMFFLAGIIAAVIMIKMFKATETGARFFGELVMRLPLFGDLSVKTACSRLARTMSTLMAAGISMTGAIEITAKIMSNRIIQLVMEDAKAEVEKGVPLSVPLETSEIFPPLICQMTKIGEETGNLEEMMDKVADYYDEEVENATKALTTVMEPMIIIVMAAVVVPIMLAILAPMMGIYSAAENAAS